MNTGFHLQTFLSVSLSFKCLLPFVPAYCLSTVLKVDEMLQTDIPDRKGILDILRDFDQTWDEKILKIKGTTEGIEALKQNGDGGDVKSERSEGGRRVEGGETMKVSCGCGRQGSGGWKKLNRWQKIRMEEEMFLRRAVERQNIQAQEERRERVNLQRQRQREDKKREEETKKREREQLENEQRLMEEEKRITGMREKVLQAQERVIDNKREECDRKINKVNKIVMETRAQVEEAKKRERDLLRKAKEIADKREECDRTVDQVNRKVLELRAQAKTAKKQKTLLEGQSVKVIDNMTTSS